MSVCELCWELPGKHSGKQAVWGLRVCDLVLVDGLGSDGVTNGRLFKSQENYTQAKLTHIKGTAGLKICATDPSHVKETTVVLPIFTCLLVINII